VKPIRVDELQGRIAHAQELMTNAKPRFDVLYVTPGTTLSYYVGTPWGLSERIVALMIPREGSPLMICPAFEEGRLREQLRWPIELRVWQEDESPYALIAKWLAERGIRTGRVAVEETTKYVFFDGLRQAAQSLDYSSGNPVRFLSSVASWKRLTAVQRSFVGTKDRSPCGGHTSPCSGCGGSLYG